MQRAKPEQRTTQKKQVKKSPLFGKKQAPKPAVKPAAEQSAAPLQGADKSLQKEIRTEQRKAYNKAVKKGRSADNKKRGSRGGNYVLYYAFAAIVAIIVFIILANTVLFNCASIQVEGILKYSAEEITEASQIKLGESLLSIDASAAERRILEKFPFVDAVKVTKSFPTKIVITVTEAERWYAVQHDGETYTISRLGKIIEQREAGKLPLVIGFEAVEPQVGGALTSAVERKTELPAEILTAAENVALTDITSINITSHFDIEVVVQDRITLQLGMSTELENKMHIAKELIATEISATESVTVNLTNTEKVYVRDNNMIDNPNTVVPVLPEGTDEATAEATGEATAEA